MKISGSFKHNTGYILVTGMEKLHVCDIVSKLNSCKQLKHRTRLILEQMVALGNKKSL